MVWGPSLSGVASGGGASCVCVCGIRRGGSVEFPVPPVFGLDGGPRGTFSAQNPDFLIIFSEKRCKILMTFGTGIRCPKPY